MCPDVERAFQRALVVAQDGTVCGHVSMIRNESEGA